jgi:hypothetical protein
VVGKRPNTVVNNTKVNWSFVEGSIRGGLCGGEGGGGRRRREVKEKKRKKDAGRVMTE